MNNILTNSKNEVATIFQSSSKNLLQKGLKKADITKFQN